MQEVQHALAMDYGFTSWKDMTDHVVDIEAGKTTDRPRAEKSLLKDVVFTPQWLTWVASATGCLRALGVDCDAADVAGCSGYAFVMNIHKKLCPSSFTAFDWRMLLPAMPALGRTTRAFYGWVAEGGESEDAPVTRQQYRDAFDFVAAEVQAGRPCVIWGVPDAPEFGIAVGVDGHTYHFRSFKGQTIAFDELHAPGGPYALAFPRAVEMSQAEGDRLALGHAIEMMTGKSRFFRTDDYEQGPKAYEMWIAAIESVGAMPFGNSISAQVYTEARHLARVFTGLLAGRNGVVAEELTQASAALGEVADALGRFAGLFPMSGSEDALNDEQARKDGIDSLRAAQAADAQALDALQAAADAWPGA